MKLKLLHVLVVLGYCMPTWGQNPIPNPGFETWMGNQPEEWFTSNLPDGAGDNVLPVSPGHYSDHALKGTVIPLPGSPEFPFVPLLESNTNDFGFPVNERFPYVSLYYKFQPASPEDALNIFVGILDDEGTVFGGGFSEITASSDTFSLLNIPLTYGPGVPYRAFLTITIVNNGPSGLPAMGSSFTLDNLEMGNGLSTATELKDPTVQITAISPNPADSTVQIAFDLKQSSTVSLRLYNSAGQQVSDIFTGHLESGSHLQSANIEDLPNGMYVCRLFTTTGSIASKINVQKN